MDAWLTRGVDAFNAGRYFAAHEIWEALWLESVGPDKQLLQGLVQIAAGYAKVETGLRSGAFKLLTRGLERVRQFLPAASGLSLEVFAVGVAADTQRVHETAEGNLSIELMRVPRLRVDR